MTLPPLIFCPECGTELVKRVPDGDDRVRKVCPKCSAIHYQNPKLVVGCFVECDGKLLLCRRAIEPAHGKWTPPAGYLEIGEGAVTGAMRETYEEARARVQVVAPQAHLDLPHIGQTYALYRATLPTPEFEPGPESLEVELFDWEDLPWDELAFPVVDIALRLLVEDRATGTPAHHSGVLQWIGEGSRFDRANYRLEQHIRTPLAT